MTAAARFVRIGLLALLCGAPLHHALMLLQPWLPLRAWKELLTLALAAIVFLNRRAAGKRRWSALDMCVLAFVLLCLVQAFRAPTAWHGLWGLKETVFWLLLYHVGRRVPLRPRDIRVGLSALAVVLLLVGVGGVAQQAMGRVQTERLHAKLSGGPICGDRGPLYVGRGPVYVLPDGRLRSSSVLSDPCGLGVFLVFGMIPLAAWLLVDRRRWPWLVPALVVGAASLCATFTRSAWLALAVGIAVLSVRLRQWLLIALLAAGAVVAVVVWPEVPHRVLTTFTAEDPSFRDRRHDLDIFLDVLRRHPFGIGLGTVGSAADKAVWRTGANSELLPPFDPATRFPYFSVDSYYLLLALQTGVQGLAAFVAVLALCLRLAGRLGASPEPMDRVVALGHQALLPALLVAALFNNVWEMLPVNILFWLGIGVMQGRYELLRWQTQTAGSPATAVSVRKSPALEDPPPIRRALGSAFTIAAASRAISFVTWAALARLLQPEALGLAAGCLLVYRWLLVFQDAGVGQALIARGRDAVHWAPAAFGMQCCLFAALALSAWLWSAPVASVLGLPEVSGLLPWVAVAGAVRSLATVPLALLESRLAFWQLTAPEAAVAAVEGCVTLPLAAAGAGAWSVVGGWLAGGVVAAVVLPLRARWRPRVTWDAMKVRRLAWFAAGNAAYALVGCAGVALGGVCVGRVLGAAALGQYGFTFMVCTAPALVLGGVAKRVLFPLHADWTGRANGLAPGAAHFTCAIGAGLGAYAALLSLTGPKLLLLVYGEGWHEAASALPVLALAGPVLYAVTLANFAFDAARRPVLALWTSLARVALLGALLWPLTIRRGLPGVSVAVVLATTVGLAVTLPVARRAFGSRGRVDVGVPSPSAEEAQA